ncbi:Mechanosensitive channel MscK [Acaryochloris thomasi RCC1774]|uniref:Mechanosensitive channel MscK n=1 Tax=Acaryochloris thomasi RCC1774 TaxID=1764569 RepID=A0A2W1JD90_9CYAN|nr:mechanosensitive ion channel domain-containing protein [Acaryochloris thomasi]PZD71736.1 Mechanosensitive channel MscK [Acaryochloris thomasi RCC1774]
MRIVNRRRLFPCLTLFVVTLSLCWTLLTPVQAQESAAIRAPVVVDGREILKVGKAGDFTAEERAEQVAGPLERAVSANKKPRIEVEERNNQPALMLNDRYLMTITAADVDAAISPQFQADRWANKLEDAIATAQSERSLQYREQAWIMAAAVALAALGIHLGLGRLQTFVLRRVLHQLPDPSESVEGNQGIRLSFRAILAIARLVLWCSAVLYIANLFPASRQLSYEVTTALNTVFTAPLFTVSNSAFSLIDLLILLALFWALVVGIGTLTQLLQTRILARTGMARGAQEIVAVIVKYALLVVGTIVLLQVWGLDLSSLTLLGSAVGVGIGFGFQDIAKNLGSGLVLLFERSVQVGDFIEVNDHMGTVERVGARSIILRTLDQISIIVPNSRLLEEEVINWSHNRAPSRLHLPVGVAYGSDLNAVKESLLKAAKDHTDVVKSPPPRVVFVGFGDSSLDFELLIWLRRPERQLLVKSDLYFHIDAILRQRNIEIPFPQRDLHVRSGEIRLSESLEAGLLHLLNGNAGHPSKSSQPNEEAP